MGQQQRFFSTSLSIRLMPVRMASRSWTGLAFFRAFVSWANTLMWRCLNIGDSQRLLEICPFLGYHSSLQPFTSFDTVPLWIVSFGCWRPFCTPCLSKSSKAKTMTPQSLTPLNPKPKTFFPSTFNHFDYDMGHGGFVQMKHADKNSCMIQNIHSHLSVKARSDFSLRSWIERSLSYFKRWDLSGVCEPITMSVLWVMELPKSLCHQQDRQSSSFILFNCCKSFALRRSRKPFAAYARTLSTKGIAGSLSGTDISISCMDPGQGKPSFTIVYCFRIIRFKWFRDVQLWCFFDLFVLPFWKLLKKDLHQIHRIATLEGCRDKGKRSRIWRSRPKRLTDTASIFRCLSSGGLMDSLNLIWFWDLLGSCSWSILQNDMNKTALFPWTQPLDTMEQGRTQADDDEKSEHE